MRTIVCSTVVLTFVAALSGCKKETKKTPPPAPASSLSAASKGTPKGTPHSAPTSGPARKNPRAAVAGRVLESMDAAGYTYLKIRTTGGDHWAAVRKAKVKKGDRVQIVRATVMKNFKSKTLKRTFASIIFGELAKSGSVGPAENKRIASAHAKVAQTRAKFDKPLKRAKGPNGRTVGQVYAQRKKLANKKISVRGKVTKVNRGILGKNWLHLQDGTGKKGAHDLTVTTKGIAKVGDVVVAEGTVRVDKNFGAGYSYSVLLEDAKVTKD